MKSVTTSNCRSMFFEFHVGHVSFSKRFSPTPLMDFAGEVVRRRALLRSHEHPPRYPRAPVSPAVICTVAGSPAPQGGTCACFRKTRAFFFKHSMGRHADAPFCAENWIYGGLVENRVLMLEGGSLRGSGISSTAGRNRIPTPEASARSPRA